MRKLYSFAVFLSLLLVLAPRLHAQPGTDPATSCPACTPAQLRTHLKTTWYDNISKSISSYSESRRRMYSTIYNYSGTVTCVYTGFALPSANTSNLDPINCEHTVPQSFFSQVEPMRSDIHHLYPTHSSVNSARSNYAVGNVPDAEAESWYTALSNVYTTRSTPPTSNPQLYSKLNSSGSNAPIFEPRDDHKGDIARSIFYFYTMYPTVMGGITRVANVDVLYQWHLQDPPSANEVLKNDRIASFQNNRNPYIDYPGSVLLAWGDQITTMTAGITVSLPKSSFYVGEAFDLSYAATGAYTSGNVFTAQLSDAAGDFSAPVTLGTVSRTSSGSITCTVPSVGMASANYRIRVVSSAPVVTGAQSAAVDIALMPPPSTVSLGTLSFTSLEQGQAFSVPYSTTGTFNAGNSFTVRLAGPGTSPTSFGANAGDGLEVGSRTATGSGSVSCTVPAGLTPGSYSLRIVASNPQVISATSAAFSVTAPVPTTITLGDVTGPLVAGTALDLVYTTTGTFGVGNVFTAQLSDATGSFAAPTVIGSLGGTADGVIEAVIPADVAAGVGYRLRIVSSQPSATSNETAAFAITAPTVPTITTGALSATTVVAGGTLTVAYATAGSFGGTNAFTAQLSDASGSFGSPVTVGSGVSPITATIPVGTVAGSNYRIRVVGSDPTTLGTASTTPLTVQNNTTAGLPIVINEIQNPGTTSDVIELLVIQNNLDLRGLIIKDFSSSMANDNGGRYAFSNAMLWESVPAGALIVLRGASAAATDVSLNSATADWTVDVGLNNTTYFTSLGGSFDLAGTEIVMLKAAGTGAAGSAGAIHAMAWGSPSGPTNLDQITAPTLRNSNTTAAGNNVMAATNATSALNDFAGTGLTRTGTATFGTGNNPTNQAYIDALRGTVTSLEPQLSLAQRVAVYPNPAVDEVRVTGSVEQAARGRLRLYDLSGRELAQWAVDRPDGVLDEWLNVSALASGLYLLRLELPEGSATWRVVKQ